MSILSEPLRPMAIGMYFCTARPEREPLVFLALRLGVALISAAP